MGLPHFPGNTTFVRFNREQLPELEKLLDDFNKNLDVGEMIFETDNLNNSEKVIVEFYFKINNLKFKNHIVPRSIVNKVHNGWGCDVEYEDLMSIYTEITIKPEVKTLLRYKRLEKIMS